VPLLPENDFLVDLDAIPEEVAERASIMWLNYPNSPTGTVASRDYLERAARFGQEHDIVVASDEAYTEIYYTDEPPPSMLEVAREGVVVFQSMSKRSCMTGYRVGWACGDERVIDCFKKVKTNIDSGTQRFVQDAAVAALKDQEHVERSRASYRRKRDMLADALVSTGLEDCRPDGTIYLWQKVPEGYTSVDFATKLLDPDIAAVTTPGAWLSNETEDGVNPGEGFVRFALVPPEDRVEQAAQAIRGTEW
jgi:LL-diaminopimelate aminotransferase